MARKRIDWERVRRLYRIGEFTTAEIAEIVGCRATTISNRVSKEGWTRDLSTEVAKQTRAALIAGQHDDAKAVEDAAAQAVAVVRAHRANIQSGRSLIYQMFAEMGAVNAAPKLIEQALIEGLAGEDVDIGLIVSAYSLPTRAKSMNALAASLAKLIAAERVAWNLDEQRSEKPYEKLLKEVIADDAEADS